MIGGLFRAGWEAHRSVPAVVSAAPLVALAPALTEALQHWVEWRIGMFAPDGTARAAHHPARTATGLLKVASLAGAGVVTARYWFHGGRLGPALRLGGRETAYLLGGLGAMGGLLLATSVGPAARGATDVSPLASRVRALLPPLVLTGASLLTQRHAVRVTAMFLGDRAMTPERAALLSRGAPALFNGLLTTGAVAPAMAVHYRLNSASIGAAPRRAALLLAADSLLVGAMAVLIGNLLWLGYRDAPLFGFE